MSKNVDGPAERNLGRGRAEP